CVLSTSCNTQGASEPEYPAVSADASTAELVARAEMGISITGRLSRTKECFWLSGHPIKVYAIRDLGTAMDKLVGCEVTVRGILHHTPEHVQPAKGDFTDQLLQRYMPGDIVPETFVVMARECVIQQ